MSLTDFRNQLKLNPPVLPDLVWLLSNSIGRAAGAAIDANKKAELQAWIDELERYVTANGKFPKFEVAYLPFSPPPVFWDYKCYKCLKWIEPNACQWVDGTISRSGWCSIWLPMTGYKAFTWPTELISGNW